MNETLLDWQALAVFPRPLHEHADRDRLVIGCPGCIERVITDQCIAGLNEWLRTLDPWLCDDDEPLPAMPTAIPYPARLRTAYRKLRSDGWDASDVRGVLALWGIEHAP